MELENSPDELRVGVKGQSNPVIADSSRNHAPKIIDDQTIYQSRGNLLAGLVEEHSQGVEAEGTTNCGALGRENADISNVKAVKYCFAKAPKIS